MSRSPYFYVERFDKDTGKYELQHPLVWNYNHTERELADLFPYNGCHDLFAIVEKNGFETDAPEMNGIHSGLPADAATEIVNAYNKCCYVYGSENEKRTYQPKARWFTYADMYIYCLEHPEVIDYEAMDEAHYNNEEENPPRKIMKPTPMKILMKRVDAFLEVMDAWDWQNDYSLIRIVYWIED